VDGAVLGAPPDEALHLVLDELMLRGIELAK